MNDFKPIWNGDVNVTEKEFNMVTLGHGGHTQHNLMYELPVHNMKPVATGVYLIIATIYPEQFGRKYSVGNHTIIIWA